MNAPEDTACERYFIPPTLTEALRNALDMEPQSYADLNDQEETLRCIRGVFKEWLRTVGMPEGLSGKDVRQLLITLVDEP